MLTFEAVFEEFATYLAQDILCTVEPKDGGYVVMLTEDIAQGPFESTLCQTPTQLQDVLSQHRNNFAAYQALL